MSAETLTPEKIAQLCAKHLSLEEMAFVAPTIVRQGEAFLKSLEAERREGFVDGADVARWVLDACRRATRSGAA